MPLCSAPLIEAMVATTCSSRNNSGTTNAGDSIIVAIDVAKEKNDTAIVAMAVAIGIVILLLEVLV